MPQALIANLIGILGACALSLWLGYEWRDQSADTQLSDCQRVHAEAIATTLRAAHAAEVGYRTKEREVSEAHQRIVHEANKQTAQAKTDADRYRIALERMRKQAAVASGSGASASYSSSSTGSQAARATSDLQADMLIRALEAAGDIAAYADHARIAGSSCQRRYEALK